MRLVVLKLGGSLLTCPDLGQRLRKLVARYEDHRILMIVGGGAAADVVRDWSHRFSLSEESAHWIALRSLSMTRGLVKTMLPRCADVDSSSTADLMWEAGFNPMLLDIELYLWREQQSAGQEMLPHTWDVTSDSIAAWVAAGWLAHELVLVKSTDLAAQMTVDRAAEEGLVDAYFPQIANQVPRIGWCNALSETPQIVPWLEHGK